MSDDDLRALAASSPPLEHMSDEDLTGLAVKQGMLQEDQAAQMLQEKKQREREPVAEALADSFSSMPGGLPGPLAKPLMKAALTKGGRVGDVAIQTGGPMAGATLGTMVEPGGGTAAGGAAGGVAAEGLTQMRQYLRGERDDFTKGGFVASGLAGAIPVGGRLLATPLRTVLTRATQGAAISAGTDIVRQLIDTKNVNWRDVAESGGFGALFGGAFGGAESFKLRRAVLKQIRQTPEFREFPGNDNELVDAVKAKLERESAAARPEPKNVTPRSNIGNGNDISAIQEFNRKVQAMDVASTARKAGQIAPESTTLTADEAPPAQVERVSPAGEQANAGGGGSPEGRIQEAAAIAGGDARANRADSGSGGAQLEPVTELSKGDQEKALRQWAQSKDLLIDDQKFQQEWEKQGKLGGSENQIIVSPDGLNFVKRNVHEYNGTVPYHGNYTRYFDNLQLHNEVFPTDAVEFQGFTDTPHGLAPVITQKAVVASRGATLPEVQMDMEAKGFTKIGRTTYENKELGVRVGDLHSENVLVDPEGNLRYIDPIIKRIEPEKGAATESTAAGAGKQAIESVAKQPIAPVQKAAAMVGPPPRPQAMGAGAPRATPAQKRVTQAQVQTRTTQQAAAGLLPSASTLQKVINPAANSAKWFRGIRSWVAPQTLDEGAARMAGILRASFGAEYGAMQRGDAALQDFRKEFDRTPVPRTWKYDPARPLPRNYQVMRAIDTGGPSLKALTPAEQAFAGTMRQLFDQAIDAVHEVSPHSLRDLLEHYFPRIWKDPAQNADKINALMAWRPLEGPKSFLKERSLQYFSDGLQQGLVPVSDNPVDVTLQKLGEMYRFVAARRAMQEARKVGLRKFKYVYEKMPEGWRAVDDPSSDVWKPPTVTVQEAYDAQLRAKTIEMLEQLGIPHERTTKLGGQRWGEAMPGLGIKTKFGGPDFVFWHEAGHMLDWRFPDLRKITNATERGPKGDQMRALADLRHEGQTVSNAFKQYVRKTEEKIANMFDAYIRAPEKFKQVAPDVWRDFNGWLDQHPEVRRPLDEVKPGLQLGAGKSEMFVGGPIKLGDWIMPEGAAQVVDNYLQPGLGRYGWFRTLRDVSGMLNSMQLVGFFHGQLVGNDSFYSGIGLALYDALNGKPMRAASELVQIPISPATSLYRGYKIQAALRNPAAASSTYRQIAQLAIEANMRAGHGVGEDEMGRQWMRSMREMLAAPNTGAAWETFWRTPLAAAQVTMKPIMKYLVPQMKLGIFGRMAVRVMEDNPGATLDELRTKLAQAADATEDRLGQVTYDNLFQKRVLKDALQLAMRAYGWQLTKYRLLAGGTADWAKAAKAVVSGQKPEATFRMSYLPAMILGHMILAATVVYLMTGRKPKDTMDYFFPDTGLKDNQGRPVRLALADFTKDVIADWRSFPNLNKMGTEWTHKLAPMWNTASEMYQNRDFYGTQIMSDRHTGEPELDHLLKNLQEGAEHLAGSAQPFSFRAGQKLVDAGADPKIGYMAPFLGFVPAPRYAIETPMQNFLSEQAGRDQYTRSSEQAQRSKIARDISQALRDRKPLTAEQQTAMKQLSKEQLKTAERRAYIDPDIWAVRALDLDRAMQAWDLANEQERDKISPTIRQKVVRAMETGGQDREKLTRYLLLVNRVTVPAAAAR